MLFAASESAVTKKPRLRLTIRRSSSVRPLGFFQVAMSRDMFTSCGIQWFAQVARYFSHAHLYLNGTSWLTSVLPLMIRLSAARPRGVAAAGGEEAAVTRGRSAGKVASGARGGAATADGKAVTARGAVLAAGTFSVVLSSSQNSISGVSS